MEAAMSSSLGATGPLLRKLHKLAVPECCRQAKLLKNDMELLRKDLEGITSSLVHLSEAEAPDRTSMYWMQEVRELSYDIEDFIDRVTPVRFKADAMAGCRHLRRPAGRVIVARLPAMSRWIARFAQFTALVRRRKAVLSSSLDAVAPLLSKLGKLPAAECCRRAKLLKKQIELLRKDVEGMSSSPSLVELSEVKTPDLSLEAGTKSGGCGHLQRLGRVVVAGLPTMSGWIARVAQLRAQVQEASGRRKRYLPLESCPFTSSTFEFTAQRPVATTNRAGSKAKAKIRHRCTFKVRRLKIARLAEARKWQKMAEIQERIRTLMREEPDLHDNGSSSFSRVFTAQCQVPTLHEEAANLVGIDGTKLTMCLKNEAEQQLKVVAIVGPGGIGKTTLAKHLYRQVGGQSDCRAFVRASRKPDTRRLLAGILAQVQRHQRPTYACSVQNLIQNLKGHLQDKRYFIVIDDLWQTTTWDIISAAFPEGNKCSRIIITTEIEDVALDCCGNSDCDSMMESLDDNNSRRLFLNRVLCSEYEHSKQLAEVSEKIIKRCGGLPLATISIASYLASQLDKSEQLLHVEKCLCSTSGANPTSQEMLIEILNFCYNSLPDHLKTCSMYLSIYPEECTIWKANLVKQWIAEGFINEIEGKDKQEVAENYFDELVNRGMIQPDRIKYADGVLSCTVHPMVHQIIKSKSKENNLITAVDYPLTNRGLSTKVRRLSLQLMSANHSQKMAGIGMPQARSLAFFGDLKCMPSIQGFKLLRVLILELWSDHDGRKNFDLRGIGRLFQLRYLKITCDVGIKLPPQVEALQYFETLEVDAREIIVPSDIFDLPVLSHLRVGGKTDLPDGIGKMTSLRTMECFDICDNSEYNVGSLGDLTNLQDLRLTCSSTELCNENDLLQSNMAALASSLAKLSNLTSLTLAPARTSGEGIVSLQGEGLINMSCLPVGIRRLELLPPACIFSRLPRWTGQLRKLCILKIVVRELLRNDIDILNGLSALTVLSLDVQVVRVGTIVVKHASFPALRYFTLRCPALCLAFRAESMRNLRKLKLCFSAQQGKRYGRMLAGVENLRILREIAARIATAAGADEADRMSAVSAFEAAVEASKQKWDAIQDSEKASTTTTEHAARPFPSVNLKWVDRDEAAIYGPSKQSRQMQKGPSVVELTAVDENGGCRIILFPTDLLPAVMSFTAPVDVCRSSAVCKAFRTAASYTVWDSFFPQDYHSILSRASDPVDFDFASTKKELFFSLAEQHVLIDHGKMSFWLERASGAKCYMLASRSLGIVWSNAPQYWRWIPGLPNSRFEEVAELKAVCWLHIIATIDCRQLSLDTRYTAYLVFNLTDDYYGLDCRTQEAIITIAGGVSAEYIVSLHPSAQETPSRMQYSQERGQRAVNHPRQRQDKWMEVELGEFYNGNLDDGEVRIQLKEHDTLDWKSGLIIEGVEIRPSARG